MVPEDAQLRAARGASQTIKVGGDRPFELLVEAGRQHSSDGLAHSRRRLPRRRPRLRIRKSPLATIVSRSRARAAGTFRYAPLSSGLNYWSANASASMRSQPCRQPPSTATASLIRLTTTLVHASGEWVSSMSQLPVAKQQRPHRLGAALALAIRPLCPVLSTHWSPRRDLDAPESPAALYLEAQKNPPRPEQGATRSIQPAIELTPGRPHSVQWATARPKIRSSPSCRLTHPRKHAKPADRRAGADR